MEDLPNNRSATPKQIVRGLFGGIFLVLAVMSMMIFGVTEWVKYELATSPTIYPDGRAVEPGRKKSGRW